MVSMLSITRAVWGFLIISLSILVRENSAVNLSMASIARLLLETVRSDQTEHNNSHTIKSQAVDIVEAPGEERRVRVGVVPQLDEEQHGEQGEGQNLGDNSGGRFLGHSEPVEWIC